jgi:hypothetical protein
MIRMGKRQICTLAALVVALVPLALAGAGNVYLVVGSDTAIWDGLDLTRHHCHFLPDLFTVPARNGYQVMDPALRSRFTDSFGQPLKLTWWMMVGNIFRDSDNQNVPRPGAMPLYLMKKYHLDAIRQFGDEISLHYHTFFWSDYNQDGIYYWNEARTFHECREEFDLTLAECLLEEEVFPVSFRSGWHFMDNEWQQRLNELLPFCMHNDSPHLGVDSIEPLENALDWSKATTSFVPYHPSSANYQLPGDGPGWEVRSVKMPSMTQAAMNQMFAAARTTDQVACLWAHLPETVYLDDLAKIDAFAHVAATNYTNVTFRYCTAVEAMQRWLGLTNSTPPQLDVFEDVEGEITTLTITSSQPIFQPQPFVALKDVQERYYVLNCNPAGPNAWTVSLPLARSDLAKVGVAVTDLNGNVVTRLLRYLPDDLFLDNLDPQYSEVAGTWASSPNAAWGTDARLALLGENDTATARWSLPISVSGVYKISFQIPATTDAAGNASFEVYSDGVLVQSIHFAAPLPPLQWVALGTPFLEAKKDHYLELTVNGSNQPNALAVADVVKVSPLVPPPAFIQNAQADPLDTTANITWTTLAAASALVEYGTNLSYGASSAMTALPVTNHVLTLAGLSPNTAYYYRVNSAADGSNYTHRGFFKTTSFVGDELIFDLTKVWKYATNDLDRVAWTTPTYDDSAWPGGPGLLWAETRPTNNPAVQPRNTRLPANPATQYPFRTYYFRSHFNVPNPEATLSLTFSNYIDDGAVFYLNGVELWRNNLPAAPAVITNASLATAYNCDGNATCPVLLTVASNRLASLLPGDNVLAVEVHNYDAQSPDLTFGAALYRKHSTPPPPQLKLLRSGELTTLYWNGAGYTLQQASQLTLPGTVWTDVPGPITNSPCPLIGGANGFYRLLRQPLY